VLGPAATQRPVLDQMLTSNPLPEDDRATQGDLGGISVIFVDIAGVEPHGTIFHIHGGGFALGSARGSVELASSLARKTRMRVVSGESAGGNLAIELLIAGKAAGLTMPDYLAGGDPANPLVSPIFADLSGLPPLLIQAGSHEVLLDDATRLAAKAAADDVAVILDITPGVPHVFQAFEALLEEGDAALDRVARFVRDNTAQKVAA
jgi:acetyl esterase/lipase